MYLSSSVSGSVRSRWFRTNATSIALVLLLTLTLAGCSGSTTTGFGWTFWSSGGMKASVSGWKTDRETRTVRLNEGDTLVITYDIEVDHGSLSLRVAPRSIRAFNDPTWYRNFEESRSGTVEIEIDQSGTYEVTATLRRFGGSYDITWKKD